MFSQKDFIGAWSSRHIRAAGKSGPGISEPGTYRNSLETVYIFMVWIDLGHPRIIVGILEVIILSLSMEIKQIFPRKYR